MQFHATDVSLYIYLNKTFTEADGSATVVPDRASHHNDKDGRCNRWAKFGTIIITQSVRSILSLFASLNSSPIRPAQQCQGMVVTARVVGASADDKTSGFKVIVPPGACSERAPAQASQPTATGKNTDGGD